MSSVLWVGFGDIAQRTAPLLIASGYSVIGARRSPVLDPGAESLSFVQGDGREVEAWRRWLLQKPDTIIISMIPTDFTEEGYRQGYLEPVQALLKALSALQNYHPQIYFVSSTSVFGDAGGDWVNEETQPNPSGFSGMVLLACEQALLASGYTGYIMRCSGIYGPGRTRLIDSVRTGQFKLHQGWTNRIHADDIARAINLLMQRQQVTGMEILHLSDDTPVAQRDVVLWLAEQLGISVESKQKTSSIPARGSKRISNDKLKSLGFEFTYPSFKQGYSQLLTPP
ncbi:NAD(P)-dependent oxidoreductase [Aliidiomarina taiwanensis]|uniref:NAD(P)-dependent oxidoreductase n=1 Tax=Aliidiomarina taiwanensis TaxID=946228 RepID=A0A432X029_9GAMM|nr:SDR family oxidoreductase [Aliidiomarina taiwanensis]RUO39389.1 NAD(P)-dependent oxidoreductase [Aliidiomarina taiwanensis]